MSGRFLVPQNDREEGPPTAATVPVSPQLPRTACRLLMVFQTTSRQRLVGSRRQREAERHGSGGRNAMRAADNRTLLERRTADVQVTDVSVGGPVRWPVDWSAAWVGALAA